MSGGGERRSRDTSGVHLYLLLWRATRAVEAFDHQQIARQDLGLSDFSVMECLLHKGPQTIGEIGSRVLLTSGSMTAAVDRLESRALVERRAHPSDRRARVVHLTSDGRKLITAAFAAHEQAMDELVEPLTQTERRGLAKLLRKLGHRAQALVEEGSGAS